MLKISCFGLDLNQDDCHCYYQDDADDHENDDEDDSVPLLKYHDFGKDLNQDDDEDDDYNDNDDDDDDKLSGSHLSTLSTFPTTRLSARDS